MYVYNLESTQAIRMRSDIGVRKPAYCTADGRAILAFQPPEVVERRARRTARSAHRPHEHRSRRGCGPCSQEVRERGYAIEDEESEIGMRCIAAPVRDGTGAVIAAVGVAGPVAAAVEEGDERFRAEPDQDRRRHLCPARPPGQAAHWAAGISQHA